MIAAISIIERLPIPEIRKALDADRAAALIAGPNGADGRSDGPSQGGGGDTPATSTGPASAVVAGTGATDIMTAATVDTRLPRGRFAQAFGQLNSLRAEFSSGGGNRRLSPNMK
jgi:hypothetical protein